MLVICDHCGLSYDDVYRLTYCPHESFKMQTVVGGPHGVVGMATSLEQYDQLLVKTRSGPGGALPTETLISGPHGFNACPKCRAENVRVFIAVPLIYECRSCGYQYLGKPLLVDEAGRRNG